MTVGNVGDTMDRDKRSYDEGCAIESLKFGQVWGRFVVPNVGHVNIVQILLWHVTDHVC